MGNPTPVLKHASNAEVREDLAKLLDAARVNMAENNVRKTADALCAAHAMAEQHRMFHEATQFRQAISILATGGKPRLLTQPRTLTERPPQ
jgi:hypothetical protein